jgi:hypothetical protein
LFATLQPLADGRLLVGFVDWRGVLRAFAAGGVLFPFEVLITPQCEIRLRHANGRISPLRTCACGPSAKVRQSFAKMLARAHGDTLNFRMTAVAPLRFYYWKLFSAPTMFGLDLTGLKGARLTALSCLSSPMKRNERQFPPKP